MSAVADHPSRQTGRNLSEGFPSGMLISGLQEEITRPGGDWQSKLKFWQFGLNLVQKMEQERFSSSELQFNRAYEGMVLLLLTLGGGLKEEIEDPEIVEHVKANMENLTSKYITFKLPPLEGPNRLLERLAA
jgi:hypothetical protein